MEKTTGEIYAKMALILTDIRAIGKSQTNQQQRFKFRGIDDLYNHLNPIMGRHGVFNTCHSIDPIIENEIESKQGTKGWHIKSQYTFRFYAGDGSFVESKAIGEAADYGDKGSNKAASIAHKYVLLEAFCIPTENIDDPDAETPEISSVSKTGSQKPAKPQRAPAAKPSDYRCISLDAIEHRKLHDGGERRYYAYHKLNTDQLISMNLLLYIAETTEPDDTETLRDLIEALEGVIDVRDNPDG